LALNNCVFTFNGSPTVSITSIPESLDFTVYPNPTSNIIYIQTVVNQLEYSLFNTVGQIVKSGSLFSNQLDCSDLRNGVYLLRIENENGISGVKRVVISK